MSSMTRHTILCWTTLAFVYVFTATAFAALVLFPFEAVASPLIPSILLGLAMRAAALRTVSRTGSIRARDELRDLTRANLGIASFTLPLTGAELALGWSHSSLLLVTGALSALAILHAAMTLAALHLPARAALTVDPHCAEC